MARLAGGPLEPAAKRPWLSSEAAPAGCWRSRSSLDVTPPRPLIRFAAAVDGVRIAYATSGSGPALVKVGTWMSHLEHDWQSPVWGHLLTWLSQRFTLVRWQYIVSGAMEPRFSKALAALTTERQMTRIQAALAPLLAFVGDVGEPALR
jgi:hypothetical protein